MAQRLLLAITCLIGLSCLAQNTDQIYFEHYSQDRGLSQGSGYTSVQFDGFMWFGTQDGLNRFDGYDFKVYKTGQTNSNFIQTLLDDKKGHLWVGTIKGLNIYNSEKDSFKGFHQFLGKDHLLQSVSVKLLMMDKLMNIWILTDENGAFYFETANKAIRHYPIFSNRLIDITEGKDGSVFVATDDDIFKLDGSRQKFVPLKMNEVLGLSKKTIFRTVLADTQNQIWAGTYEDGLFLLENRSGNLILQKHFTKGSRPYNLSGNEITRVMEDSKGRIWIGTRTGGISVYHPADQNFIHVLHQETEPLSLSDDYILSFYEDRQNNVWIGVSGRGFEKYDPRKYQFGLIRKNEDKPDQSLSDNMVFKIYGHKNYLYFGTQSGGLTRFDPVLNQFKIYKSNPGNIKSLLHNEVYDISADKTGDLWLALGKGLCRFDPETQHFKSLFREGQQELVYLYAVQALNNDEIWTGGQRGLFRFDSRTEQWKNWNDQPEIKAISGYVIRLIYEDSEGDIWFGTIGHGLLKYSAKTKKIIRFNKTSEIDCPNIRAVYEDRHTFWIGTDCGVYELDKRTNAVVRQFSETSGLPNNVVYTVLKDKKGIYWFSTNKGLTAFDAAKKTFKNYDASDGLQSNEFNTNCSFMADDGTLYFGGVNGISFFRPDRLTSNQFAGPVRITNIKVMDQAYIDSIAVPYLKAISLPYDQNYISFEFSALNFSNSERNSYKYQMQGLTKRWIDAGNRRTANYTNLPPGDYTFRVKGSNNDGIENPQEAAIKIHIHPPFWKATWFITLLFLLFLGILYFIYKYKIALIRKEEQQKAEIKQIRTEAEAAILRANINPDFVFDGLNTIETYVLTNRRREATNFIQVFSKLIRKVVENSRQELVCVEDELTALKLFVQLEEERYNYIFRTEFDIDAALLENKNQIPPLLVQPFVENAIAYGSVEMVQKQSLLKIIMKCEKPLLKVIIEHSGIEKEEPKKMNGNSVYKNPIDITLKRITALGNLYESKTSYKITDNDMGTRVELFLPLK
ncbi:two-component regulator propeller domain-containing protein [Dyadobacter sp. NIV53]|uniref:ligand-binding sensor domain-containing protein n=1 Tax=Dyadobacter sp. NIV53 TaxID=2861765 RepID=UPI001C86A56D|nr:sensor histidine kinase [Dyadobacter sp. NIV53]